MRYLQQVVLQKFVDVTDKMIDMVRSVNIKWKEDLERKKKERLDVLDAERKKDCGSCEGA